MHLLSVYFCYGRKTSTDKEEGSFHYLLMATFQFPNISHIVLNTKMPSGMKPKSTYVVKASSNDILSCMEYKLYSI